MKGKDLLNKIELADPAFVEEADRAPKIQNNRWLKWVSMAACVCVLAIGIIILKNNFKITDEQDVRKIGDVTVSKIDDMQGIPYISKSLLVSLTEDEIFSKTNLVIARGKVTKIENIEMNFGGYIKVYRAIATVKIDKVIKGKLKTGSSMDILLPTAIAPGVYVEDTGIISQLRVGMEGIFMPCENEKDAYIEYYGVPLMARELARYGLPDGMRFAFLATEKGLVFEKGTTYQRISNARTLEDIEEYIADMLEKNKALCQ